MHIVGRQMLKLLRQLIIIQYNKAHSYAEENHILIPILKYSSVFIMLGVKLTKYQQIVNKSRYSTCCAANVYISGYIFIGTPIVPLKLLDIHEVHKHIHFHSWSMQ